MIRLNSMLCNAGFCRRLLAVVCAGTCFLLTACSPETDSVSVPKKTSVSENNLFRIYETEKIQDYNYLATNSEILSTILANTIDCLVEYDSYGNIIPSLAESWSYNDSMTQWTFQIRPGVQWLDSEGNPYAEVVADDWVAAAEYINNAENNSEWQTCYTTHMAVQNAQAYYEYTAHRIGIRDEKRQRAEEIRESLHQKKNNKSETSDPTETTGETEETEIATSYPSWYSENSENDPGFTEFTEFTEDTQETSERIREILPRDIGVQAPEKHTLVFTLDSPCPYFLDLLSSPAFLPVNRQFLQQSRENFGQDYQHILYNGAYLLTDDIPDEKQILTKNSQYWDKQNIYIDRLELIYSENPEQFKEDSFLSHQIDRILISPDSLDQWMNDAETKDLVHPMQPDHTSSYFYVFNFDPQFDEKYNPQNWKIAVNHENFRQAVIHAINPVELVSLYESRKPERFLNRTITPKEFTFGAGTDYTQFTALAPITAADSYNPTQAQELRDLAREELTNAGAVFPIQVFMPYDSSVPHLEQECELVKKQLETTLGTDFIQVELYASRQANLRESGNFAFMKCSVTADYMDPQTWAEPFQSGQNYTYWDRSEYHVTQEIFQNWQEKYTQATENYGDKFTRYTAFAEAEQILISHAVVLPLSTEISNYVISRLTPFESEYALTGIASRKLKFCRMSTTSVNMNDYERLYDKWLTQRRISLK
ncbi:MAG: hypothetical protein K2H29_06180 [Oscillospiraceae bacterium]|nr:hypothetical protein [Oscillospiraceae bacterium]